MLYQLSYVPVYEMICIHQIPGQAVSIVGARWMRKQRGSEEYQSTGVPECQNGSNREKKEAVPAHDLKKAPSLFPLR